MGVRRGLFHVAFESHGSEIESGATRVAFIHPVVGRPGKKVGDEKCDARCGADRIERRVGLDAVQLDVIAGFDEWQDADLRVTVCWLRDPRAVTHLRDETFGGPEAWGVARARK